MTEIELQRYAAVQVARIETGAAEERLHAVQYQARSAECFDRPRLPEWRAAEARVAWRLRVAEHRLRKALRAR